MAVGSLINVDLLSSKNERFPATQQKPRQQAQQQPQQQQQLQQAYYDVVFHLKAVSSRRELGFAV